jgi:uncharacterized protein YgiM (DUF1202 family)
MNRRLVLVLVSALHICIFALAVVLIYKDVFIIGNIGDRDNSKESIIDTVESEEEIFIIVTEPETAEVESTEDESTIEIESTTEEIESEMESENIIESEIEIETTTEPTTYTFTSTNRNMKLNIRETPSANAKIIGKIPPRATGTVISIVDDDWVYIEYKGVKGYCSRKYINIKNSEF